MKDGEEFAGGDDGDSVVLAQQALIAGDDVRRSGVDRVGQDLVIGGIIGDDVDTLCLGQDDGFVFQQLDQGRHVSFRDAILLGDVRMLKHPFDLCENLLRGDEQMRMGSPLLEEFGGWSCSGQQATDELVGIENSLNHEA